MGIDITMEGFCETKSGMIMLLLTPVVVWTVFRGNPAYKFISFVRGPNLLTRSLGAQMEQLSTSQQSEW